MFRPTTIEAFLMPGIKNQAITQTIQNKRTTNLFRCDPGGVLIHFAPPNSEHQFPTQFFDTARDWKDAGGWI
jgi:hypothetical protein